MICQREGKKTHINFEWTLSFGENYKYCSLILTVASKNTQMQKTFGQVKYNTKYIFLPHLIYLDFNMVRQDDPSSTETKAYETFFGFCCLDTETPDTVRK